MTTVTPATTEPATFFTTEWDELWATFGASATVFAGRLLTAIIVLIIGWLLINFVVMPICRRLLLRNTADDTVSTFSVIAIGSLLKIFLFMGVVDLLGVSVLSFAAFLAAFGVGFGSSISTIFMNFIAGVVIVVQKPLGNGDYVSFSGGEGDVKRIGLTHTIIKTPQAMHLFVPNSTFTHSTFINYNREPKMRVDTLFKVRHTQDLEVIHNVFIEICARDSRICTVPKPMLRVSQLGDDGIAVSVRPWVLQADYWGVYFDLKSELQKVFARSGIPFQINRMEVDIPYGIHTTTRKAKDPFPLTRPEHNMKENDIQRLATLDAHWNEMIDELENEEEKGSTSFALGEGLERLKRFVQTGIIHRDGDGKGGSKGGSNEEPADHTTLAKQKLQRELEELDYEGGDAPRPAARRAPETILHTEKFGRRRSRSPVPSAMAHSARGRDGARSPVPSLGPQSASARTTTMAQARRRNLRPEGSAPDGLLYARRRGQTLAALHTRGGDDDSGSESSSAARAHRRGGSVPMGGSNFDVSPRGGLRQRHAGGSLASLYPAPKVKAASLHLSQHPPKKLSPAQEKLVSERIAAMKSTRADEPEPLDEVTVSERIAEMKSSRGGSARLDDEGAVSARLEDMKSSRDPSTRDSEASGSSRRTPRRKRNHARAEHEADKTKKKKKPHQRAQRGTEHNNEDGEAPDPGEALENLTESERRRRMEEDLERGHGDIDGLDDDGDGDGDGDGDN